MYFSDFVNMKHVLSSVQPVVLWGLLKIEGDLQLTLANVNATSEETKLSMKVYPSPEFEIDMSRLYISATVTGENTFRDEDGTNCNSYELDTYRIPVIDSGVSHHLNINMGELNKTFANSNHAFPESICRLKLSVRVCVDGVSEVAVSSPQVQVYI